jgi:hypothetical protein
MKTREEATAELKEKIVALMLEFGERTMSEFYYLNDDKSYRLATLIKWGEQFGSMDRHLGNDIVNGKWVSTVWLGLNHNLGEGAPHLFETMVFEKAIGSIEIFCERYSTWQEADEGHQRAIQWIKDGCRLDDCERMYD